jgi:hypothetical protein
VITPCTDDGQRDLTGLRRLISWQLDSGSHGISLGGSTGESLGGSTGEPSAQTPAADRRDDRSLPGDRGRVPFLRGYDEQHQILESSVGADGFPVR